MLIGLLAASIALQGSVRTVELSRGAKVVDTSGSTRPFTYWDTEDTTLDATDPDASRGGEGTLIGGPSSTILIRFGDLDRVLGTTRHIGKATLHLSTVGGDKPELGSMRQLLAPWGEGPLQSMSATIARLGDATSADGKGARPGTPRLAATWRARLFGADNGNWQLAGAKGPSDSKLLDGIKVSTTDKDIAIENLAPVIQWQADHPTQNFGIALSFSNNCEFFSAQAPQSRPRLELELSGEAAQNGPDLSVVSIDRRADGGFVAEIKNFGDQPSAGFTSVWTSNGREGSELDHPDSIPPGGTVNVELRATPKGDPSDHRSSTLNLTIHPKGPDAVASNDSLTIYPEGRAIRFSIDPAVGQLAKAGGLLGGGRSVADWLQAQIRIFNDVYLAQSRYSFAADGCRERVFASSIVADSDHSEGAKGPGLNISPAMFISQGVSEPLLRAIGKFIGLADLSVMNVSPGDGRVEVAGAADRGTGDLYPGLMGGGDTRFDGAIPGMLSLSYEPKFTSGDEPPTAEATGLLSMTDVAELNIPASGSTSGLPIASPKAVLLRVRDFLDRPIAGAQLSFFQMKAGKIAGETPVFKSATSDAGTLLIPNRDGAGIFGKLEPDGSNGLLLVKAELNGVTEWGWIKAWQVIDSLSRGNSAAIMDLTLDLPGSGLDTTRNLASLKFVSDSKGQGADVLSAAVDGNLTTKVSLGDKAGDWIEVDLGRDRAMSEIKIAADSSLFWNSFDLVVYGTGQRPQDGFVFARERNWRYSRRNRSDRLPGGATVSYRGFPLQVRYVRIVSRSGGPAEISEISVTPAKLGN